MSAQPLPIGDDVQQTATPLLTPGSERIGSRIKSYVASGLDLVIFVGHEAYRVKGPLDDHQTDKALRLVRRAHPMRTLRSAGFDVSSMRS